VDQTAKDDGISAYELSRFAKQLGLLLQENSRDEEATAWQSLLG
jgi:hypothetical protein